VGHHLRIKICGITNAEDARQAAALGTDAIGLNFHPESPRFIEISVAQEILRAIPPFVEPVGVFTDTKRLTHLSTLLHLKWVQWHGELADFPALIPGAMTRLRFIVAFRIHDQNSIDNMKRWVNEAINSGGQPAVLIDSYEKGSLGGTGKTAPWGMLAELRSEVPLILAGGLTPENVAEAVRIVRPYAVDVASGVESSPGRKDVEKMKRFIDNARSAAG
jgi:phosphoribosylanthranilate isomerase